MMKVREQQPRALPRAARALVRLTGSRSNGAHAADRRLRNGRPKRISRGVAAAPAIVTDAKSRMACRQPANQQWNHHNSAHDLEYPSNVALKRHAPVVVFSGLPCPRNVGNDKHARSPIHLMLGGAREMREARKLLRAPGVDSLFRGRVR